MIPVSVTSGKISSSNYSVLICKLGKITQFSCYKAQLNSTYTVLNKC